MKLRENSKQGSCSRKAALQAGLTREADSKQEKEQIT